MQFFNKKNFLLLILCCHFAILYGQSTIGIPEIINYGKADFGAGLQTWDIDQDKNGIIYFANNEGLLTYDGNNWNLFPLPNKTIVRSVHIDKGRIYVGGQDEIGYFDPSETGNLQYHSLINFIPSQNRTFADVWDIASTNASTIFRTEKYLFTLANSKISVTQAPTLWNCIGTTKEQILVHDKAAGILELKGNLTSAYLENNSYFINSTVTGILPYTINEYIISTEKGELYHIKDRKAIPIKISTFGNNVLTIYKMQVLDGQILLGTSEYGVLIVDIAGNLIQQISETQGLQTNNCLALFTDMEKNLWLGLNNGISLSLINNPIKQIKPDGKDGSGYTSALFKEQLYLGSSDGLFSVPIKKLGSDFSYELGKFSAVTNAKGQVWSLNNINDKLLIGMHQGALTLKGQAATLLSSNSGYWGFQANIANSKEIIAGNYNGIHIFKNENEELDAGTQIQNFDESSRYIALDNKGGIWVSHPYHGVFRLIRNGSGSQQKKYSVKEGLPSESENYIFNIGTKIAAGCIDGIYFYDSNKDRFEKDKIFAKAAGNLSVRYIKKDSSDNLWIVSGKQLGIVQQYNSNAHFSFVPELTGKILSGFESINILNQENILISGVEGFYHFNLLKYRKEQNKLTVHISKLITTAIKDSTIYGGFSNDLATKEYTSIEESVRSMRFIFSSTSYSRKGNIEYSTRLVGFDSEWSPWTKRNEKEYSNLMPGKYSFEVKARNSNDAQSTVAVYTFRVLPKWYQTNIAYVLYLVIFGSIVYLVRFITKRKLKKQLLRHEQEQAQLKYIHELEQDKKESEIINLQNEKLAAAVAHKNTELASSTMHLVKKGELISKLSEELKSLSKQFKNSQFTTAAKKMLGSLNEDEKLDEDWEIFSNHFDEVHSDFTKNLKQKHPKLTGGEMKLCINLRMNLSTKEIAQLMNISVRGVEVSRYRLRKKLELPSDASLYDYLMGI